MEMEYEVNETVPALAYFLIRDGIKFEFSNKEYEDKGECRFHILSANPVQIAVKKGKAVFTWESEVISDAELMERITNDIIFNRFEEIEEEPCNICFKKEERGCRVEMSLCLLSTEDGECFANEIAYNLFCFQSNVNGISAELKKMWKG